jgi:ABC-type antimicrobial peptide transport system permease subunit
MIFLAITAIVLSILGVIGLVNHTLNQRTKEIAIRKVSGSTSWSIFRSLTWEFVFIIIIASLFGTFGARYIYNDFPLNHPMPFRVFDYLLGIIMTLIITLFSIAYKTLKESTRNPVESLRYE